MQKHNEEKLNKAYETSEAVHLIFSVNSSGFFQGWARMTSRITVGQVLSHLGVCAQAACSPSFKTLLAIT